LAQESRGHPVCGSRRQLTELFLCRMVGALTGLPVLGQFRPPRPAEGGLPGLEPAAGHARAD